MISGLGILAGILIISSCITNRDPGYNPAPRAGAEYRFEEGLRKEKRPQHLFDKKTRKDMAKMGYPTGESNPAPEAAREGKAAVTTPKPDTKKIAPADSLRMDSVYKVRPQ